ncbi:hypothetical protein TcasGA2_TC000033 [Tribolium castaneum]|uniref:Reverse transcriptase domain-containing protein n=1 Tax=Tribolium castaneum TaxID=7070 RepID=D6WE86_TRICA|nr:hypothetical protein TcasGA2_TC000033 [Tribolium castaneum]
MARISDFKEENQVFVPKLVIQEASEAINKVVPAKSKQLYEKEYSNFCEWRKRKDAKGADERIILAYISERSKNAKSSSLWAYYSQLKKMLSVKENIDISRKLRPESILHKRLFINYRKQKCTVQPVGINTISKFPENIARFLCLPNPEEYTGHSFRRSSATLLADSGADLAVEKMIYQRISPLIEDILPSEQAGFRPQRSCCDQVLALTTHIESGFEKRLKTGAVLLDLTAAYDTVWKDGLIHKLYKVVPCKQIVSLIESMLTNRKFRVFVGEKSSKVKTLNNGLPQGAVLSPLLFNWRLCVNPSKTEVSCFHLSNSQKERKLNVSLNGILLKHNFHPVYLGVSLDCSLTYKFHLEKLRQKLKTRNNILLKLAGSTWGANAKTLRVTALALVFSTAEYCSAVWMNSSHTSKIDAQLNTAMRVITGTLKPTPTEWLPVLSNSAPPALRRKLAVKKLWNKYRRHPQEYPIWSDLIAPENRLKSRKPFWVETFNIENFFIINEWRNIWSKIHLFNKDLIEDPSKRVPGMDQPRLQKIRIANVAKWKKQFNILLKNAKLQVFKEASMKSINCRHKLKLGYLL